MASSSSAPSVDAPARFLTIRVLTQLEPPEHELLFEGLDSTLSVRLFRTTISRTITGRPNPAWIRLIHAGHSLTDDAANLHQVFGDAPIVNNRPVTLHMVIRLPTGVSDRRVDRYPRLPFSEQEHSEALRAIGRAGRERVTPPNIPHGQFSPDSTPEDRASRRLPRNIVRTLASPHMPRASGMPANLPVQPNVVVNNGVPGGLMATGSPAHGMGLPQAPAAANALAQNAQPSHLSSEEQSDQDRAATLSPAEQVNRRRQGASNGMTNLYFSRDTLRPSDENTGGTDTNANNPNSASTEVPPNTQGSNQAQAPGQNTLYSQTIAGAFGPTGAHIQPNVQPVGGQFPTPPGFPQSPSVQFGDTTGPNGERVQMMQSGYSGSFPVYQPPFPSAAFPIPAQIINHMNAMQSQQTIAYILSSPNGPHAIVYTADGIFSSGSQGGMSTSNDNTHNPPASTATTNMPGSGFQQPGPNQGMPPPEGHQPLPRPEDLARGQPGAQPAPPAHPVPNAQVPPEGNADVFVLLGVIFRHIWLMVRVVGVIWLLTRGASNGRTLMIIVCAGVLVLAQAGIFGETPMGWMRARFERAANGGGNVAPAQNAGLNAPNPPGREDQTGARGTAGVQPAPGGWQQAVILFLASLFPGLGEQQVRAREQIQMDAREAQPREEGNNDAQPAPEGQLPQQENNSNGNWQGAGRALTEGEGDSTAVDSNQEGEVRERRVTAEDP